MRKIIIACLMVIVVTVMASGCGGAKTDSQPAAQTTAKAVNTEYDSAIKKAIGELKKAWEKDTKEHSDVLGVEGPYVKITNTRVIRIKAEPVNVENNNEPIEQLEDVDAIIEFMLISNYYGDSYPTDAGVNNTVVVYKNGKMKVQQTNLLNSVRARYYLTDYSGVIEEIIDLEDAYSGELF